MNDSLPATPAPAAAAQPEPTIEQHSVLNAREQVIAVADLKALVKSGTISPEVAAQSFDELGVPPEQRAPDTRSEAVKLLDTHFPPAKPEEFILHYGQPMTPELKEFDTSARTWLSGAQLDRTLGNTVVNTIARVAKQTERMTPDELEVYGQSEMAKLQTLYGDQVGEKLRAAGRMVEVLDRQHPGLKNLLKSNGIGDNALVAKLLVEQAERWQARRR